MTGTPTVAGGLVLNPEPAADLYVTAHRGRDTEADGVDRYWRVLVRESREATGRAYTYRAWTGDYQDGLLLHEATRDAVDRYLTGAAD